MWRPQLGPWPAGWEPLLYSLRVSVKSCKNPAFLLWLTAQQQASQQVLVLGSGAGVAVPAMVPELVLTLGDPVLHPTPDGLHHPGVLPAKLALPVHQTRDVIAHHLRAQRAHVPVGGGRTLTDTWELFTFHSWANLKMTQIHEQKFSFFHRFY